MERDGTTWGTYSNASELKVVTENLAISSKSKTNAYGIYPNNSISKEFAKVKNSIVIEAIGGKKGYGIYGTSSTLNLTADKEIQLTTNGGDYTYGIYDASMSNIDLKAEKIVIETKTHEASSKGYLWGVAHYDGNISIKASEKLVISTSTNLENDNEFLSVYGIMSYGDTNKNSVTLSGNEITIDTISSSFTTYEAGATGGVYSSSSNYTKIEGKEKVSINVRNNNENNEGGVYGIFVRKGSDHSKYPEGGKVDIYSPKVDINVSGRGDVRGIHVANYTNPSLGLKEFATLSIESDEINVYSEDEGTGRSIGVSAFSEGRMYLDGNSTIKADDAIGTRGDSIIRINRTNGSGKYFTRINGDIHFNYDGPTSSDNINAGVSVLFNGKDSYWEGSPRISWTAENKLDEQKLTITGLDLTFNSCAVWIPVKVESYFSENEERYGSPVNTLELNNGVIRFDSPDIVAAAETVKGSRAIVHTPVLLEGDSVQSSHFVYENTSENTPEFKVIFSGITADQLTDNVRNELSRAILRGTVDYKHALNPVISTDATPSPQKQAVPEGLISGAQIWEVGQDGKVKYDSIVEAENTVNSALFDVAVSNYLFYRSQMNDGVSSRMGDLRSAPKENGAWARVFGGENKYSGRDMKLKYTDLEIGADHFFNENYYLGGLLTYSKGDGTLSNGNTDHENYSFGLYGGWLGDNGMYADFVVRYLRLDSDFNILRKQGSVIDAFNDCSNCSPSMFPSEENKGSYKNNAYAASVEIGRRVFNSARSFYVEPQTELRFGRIKSSSYHTNRGVLVKQDKTDSVVGRIGVAVGKVFNENKGNAYFNVSVLHDWKGKIKQTYSKDGVSRTYRDDVGGIWGEFTLGSTYKPSENVSVYGSVRTSVGSPIRNPWQVNFGMRYNF